MFRCTSQIFLVYVFQRQLEAFRPSVSSRQGAVGLFGVGPAKDV